MKNPYCSTGPGIFAYSFPQSFIFQVQESSITIVGLLLWDHVTQSFKTF